MRFRPPKQAGGSSSARRAPATTSRLPWPTPVRAFRPIDSRKSSTTSSRPSGAASASVSRSRSGSSNSLTARSPSTAKWDAARHLRCAFRRATTARRRLPVSACEPGQRPGGAQPEPIEGWVARKRWGMGGEARTMFRTLVKTDAIAVDDHTVAVRYFELRTLRGGRRYSAEILLGPGDRIILDDDSVTNLEARAEMLVPATLYSRVLAARPTAA